MSAAEEKRASREELSRLRIDRDAIGLREAAPWRSVALIGGLVVAFALVGFLGWRLTWKQSDFAR